MIMNFFVNCSWFCCWNNANSNENNRNNAEEEELEPFQKQINDEEEDEIQTNVKKPVFKQPGPAAEQ